IRPSTSQAVWRLRSSSPSSARVAGRSSAGAPPVAGHPVNLTAILLIAGLASPAFAACTPETPSAAPEPRPELGPPTALRLFADVEDAWATSDAERLASLVDTSAVRIAVKPGAPLTAALTRVAAAFLLQDQLRLVRTQGFQMTRFQYVPEQRAFFTEFLIPLVREYREDAGSADLFFIMGNDDWRANLPVLLRAGIERFHHIHRTVRRLDAETWIAGLGSVSLTPFALKDWERGEEGL